MSLRKTFTCDYCNPEGDTEGDNDDGQSRYEIIDGEGTPTGWWPVPEKGRGDKTGHACPTCIISVPSVMEDVSARRQAETERLTGVPYGEASVRDV